MPDDPASETLRIANLLLLAGRTEQRQDVLKEVQVLRQRLMDLRADIETET